MCTNCNQPDWYCPHNRGTGKFEPLKQIKNIKTGKKINKKMANIPPKSFYKLSKEEQWMYAVNKMNEAYKIGDTWKKISQEVRGKKIEEPEIERPDEAILKDA
jgi:hypothetical protein